MIPLINIDIFLGIFQNPNYRRKLDEIILNFFGIVPQDIIEINNLNHYKVTLEFIICIEKKIVMKIAVKDTKNLFKQSKKFFINFSLEAKNRSYQLLYPCYWEFYCNNCVVNRKLKYNIEILASLLAITKRKKLKKSLKKIKIFTKKEIKDIMKKI